MTAVDENAILASDPSFFQIVQKPTRKDNLLSIIITDLRRFYVEPQIINPIPVDDHKSGVPSEHNGVLAIQVSNTGSKKRTTKEIKIVQPMPQSSIFQFSESIDAADWYQMLDGLSSSDMVDLFQKMTIDLKDIHFPKKTISITPYDKPWITEELKVIRRRRQRIYRKEGRSMAYLNLKDEFDKKLKLEAAKYVKKLNEEVSSGKRGSSYAAIRKLGNRDFAESKGRETFDVPEFLDNNFDDNQSAEALADFFSSISQEFQPLDVNNFSPDIKDELERGRAETKLPLLNEFKVYSKIS